LLAVGAADRDGFVPIYVNFLGVLIAADVAERIERAYREQLDGPLRRWFAGVVSTLRPRVKATPGGVGVEVAPETHIPELPDRLALPRRLQERHGRRCAIVFDEFQDVVRVGDALVGTIRSELEQHGKVATGTQASVSGKTATSSPMRPQRPAGASSIRCSSYG
jgi:hypothetical protein